MPGVNTPVPRMGGPNCCSGAEVRIATGGTECCRGAEKDRIIGSPFGLTGERMALETARGVIPAALGVACGTKLRASAGQKPTGGGEDAGFQGKLLGTRCLGGNDGVGTAGENMPSMPGGKGICGVADPGYTSMNRPCCRGVGP